MKRGMRRRSRSQKTPNNIFLLALTLTLTFSSWVPSLGPQRCNVKAQWRQSIRSKEPKPSITSTNQKHSCLLYLKWMQSCQTLSSWLKGTSFPKISLDRRVEPALCRGYEMASASLRASAIATFFCQRSIAYLEPLLSDIPEKIE